MPTFAISPPLCVRRPALRPLCARALVARRVVEYAVRSVPIRLRYPDGAEVGGGGPDSPVIDVVRPTHLFDRLAHAPKIGLGEAYMAGDWRAAEGSDLAEVLTPFAERVTTLLPRWLMRLRAVVDRRHPRTQRNTLTGSRRNIQHHYDLSNELFVRFLDPTLSYSSALFDPGRDVAVQSLEDAQRRKVASILDLAEVGAGTRLLEIGTGWGSLAIAAAQRGAHVTSITLSQQQLDHAAKRVSEAGVGDRVDLLLQDYRETVGEFDAVVSVEMIEAVGEEYWPTYFATIDRLLAPGGRAAIQAILMDHDRLLATRNSFGWIQKYIFPGGLIPSVPAIEATLAAHTGLTLATSFRFGQDYAETLRRWRARFEERWPEISEHGFDETFRRMWEFYLAYCEAGFAVGYLDVAQLALARRPGR